MKPSTKYQMMFGGEMRPVSSMWAGQVQVYDPLRAVAAVLYVNEDEWITIRVTHPADITLAPRSMTSEGRDWDTIR